MVAVAPQKGSAAIPEAESQIPPTPLDACDQAVADVKAKADAWLHVTIGERQSILGELIRDTLAASERWVEAGVAAKGITPGTPQEGEEWLGGPMVVIRNLRLLVKSLRDIEEKGAPQLPGPVRQLPNGQTVAKVFPASIFDTLLFTGFEAEIWMQPGVTPADLASTQGVIYRGPKSDPKVALVLGAGNVSSIGPMDALYKLFVEDQVVVLKMNPVNEYTGPFIAEAFDALVRRGFLRIVYGGVAQGAHLCQHAGVDEIHITGSDKTHDAIVFGVGDEGRKNKANKTPRNTKRITSELGNVSPVIVVPGPWSPKDVDFQGANLASMLTNNAGFNCNATRVIINHEGWGQRQELLGAIGKVFAATPARDAYYPGAEQRFKAFMADHEDRAKQYGGGAGKLPWTIISDLDADNEQDICFTTEAFCSVTSEVTLSAASTVEYIRKAVDFCNDQVWGTLNSAIIVHPKSLKDPAVREAVEQAVADLRSGTVAVNHWPALAYGFGTTTWGAFPGHDMYDIRSGVGVVHNSYLFDKPQKTVVRGPFRVQPKPPWFVTNKKSHEIARKITHFEAYPSVFKLPSIIWSAMRG